ncbi:MAG: peptide deformylase [Kiritimatiellae bacterium]|nr:peptide deformylase [Kiritimatiellia bacterium]MDD4736685.1 peptide deformylase [Kiritimatiellia bacterium]
MILSVCTYGDPVLREKSEPIDVISDELRALARDMLETMYAENGVGLAAQQVGKTMSLCVVDVPPDADVDEEGLRENPDVAMPLILCNPKLVKASEVTCSREEGCLSFPGVYGNVIRPARVTVSFMDLDGKVQEIDVQGLVARAVQHEMDHLAGVVFVDRFSHVKKLASSGKLKRLVRDTKERMAQGS